MSNQVTTGGYRSHPGRRAIAVAAMMSMTICAVSSIVSAKSMYIINDGERSTVVESSGYTPSAVVKNAGIEISPSDQVISGHTASGTPEITIVRGQDVAVNYQGSTLHVKSYYETVSHLLDRLNIPLSSEDEVSIDLSNYTEDGMVIDVIDYSFGTVEAVEPVTYTTERVANPNLAKGKENVKQAGKNGSANVTYNITYKNGVESDRQAISSEMITAPVNEIIEYGTKVSSSVSSSDRIASDSRNSDGSGTLTFNSGSVLTYSRVINGQATAYTAKPGALTASGKPAYVGGVAVDPKVIPLGTKLYITTPDGRVVYGMATAVDTGGAIKGNIIDLFYSSYRECIQFGRRACTIYVLN